MDTKGQFTISNILGVFVILFIMFVMRDAIYMAISSALTNTDSLLNQIPYLLFPAFFLVIIIMLIFYEKEPRYERGVTR